MTILFLKAKKSDNVKNEFLTKDRYYLILIGNHPSASSPRYKFAVSCNDTRFWYMSSNYISQYFNIPKDLI